MKPTLSTRLWRGAGAALTVQAISGGLLYGSQVLLARWMGTAAYGIYNYAAAVGILGAFVAGLGLPAAVLRFVSAYQAQEDWPHLRGIIWGSWWQTLLVGIVASVLGTGIVWLLGAGLERYQMPLMMGIWTIPVVALTSLQKEIIRAFQKIVLSYGPSLLVQPLLLVAMVMLWRYYWPLTSTAAIALSLVASVCAIALQWLIFQTRLEAHIHQATPAYELARWWQTAIPLMLFSGSFMVLNQTDTLMIGYFLSAEDVGIYGVALKTAAWVPFILGAVNAISAPLIASLYAQGDDEGLQQLVSTVAQWMFFPALATAFGITIFATPILQLFGAEFVAAKHVLMILILGQLVNVGAGSVGYLMSMTGHQNQSLVVMATSALVNVVLNLVGIHYFGIVGAAIATALSMAMWNIWLYRLVVQKLGVRPSILDAFCS